MVSSYSVGTLQKIYIYIINENQKKLDPWGNESDHKSWLVYEYTTQYTH